VLFFFQINSAVTESFV